MDQPSLKTLPRLSPGVRLSVDPISGDWIALYPEGFIVLNSSAYEVAVRCDGSANVEQIVLSLEKEFDATIDNLRREVGECLSELHRQRIIKL